MFVQFESSVYQTTENMSPVQPKLIVSRPLPLDVMVQVDTENITALGKCLHIINITITAMNRKWMLAMCYVRTDAYTYLTNFINVKIYYWICKLWSSIPHLIFWLWWFIHFHLKEILDWNMVRHKLQHSESIHLINNLELDMCVEDPFCKIWSHNIIYCNTLLHNKLLHNKIILVLLIVVLVIITFNPCSYHTYMVT